MSTAPVSQNIDYGDDFGTSLDGTWSGSNLGGASVYLQVVDSGNTFTMPPVQAAPASNTFHYALNAITNVQAGDRTGTLTVRACKDVACSQAYANASASVTYRLQVAAVGDWETIQRDATHNGYIPVRVDPTRISKAWEWTAPKDAAAAYSFVGRPVTGPGALYAVAGSSAADGSYYDVTLNSLDENTGAVKWTYRPTWRVSAGGAAAAGGLVYMTTPFSETHFFAVDANTGTLRFRYTQTVLPSIQFAPPTVFGGTAYFTADTNAYVGFGQNEIHAADAVTGTQRWARPRAGALFTTPAADQNHLYYAGNHALHILDRATGATLATVADPASSGAFSWPVLTVPVLGSRGNVLLNSYAQNEYRLTSFNVAARQWEWTTQASYRPLFAATPGVIYAVKARGFVAPTLDAIDEATGKVVGTWSPPPADLQQYLDANIIATRNLVFLSTARDSGPGYTYAIDRSTLQTVWSYPESGNLIMSANRTLYLLVSSLDSDQFAGSNRIVAFKLR